MKWIVHRNQDLPPLVNDEVKDSTIKIKPDKTVIIAGEILKALEELAI